jgi:hypothetical protein
MKSKHLFPAILAACAAIALLGFRSDRSNELIAFPDGYRDWTHVKTYIVGPKNPAFKLIGGFNHVYANEQAIKGYMSGDFPDGSVIVSDVIATLEDSITIREGSRDHIDVMMKDNGAWAFETFKAGNRMLTVDIEARCVSCHKKEKDMVFSVYRE